MFHNTALHFINNPEKMLKSFNNNNTSAFSMENLLSREKLSPENLEIEREDSERNPMEKFPIQHDKKLSLSPSDNTRISESENDRLSPASPAEKNDIFLRFNNCFKNAICSSCGRLECNFFQCRMSDGGGINSSVVKDNKPVLKFSVSAILGTENPTKHIQNGKCEYVYLWGGKFAINPVKSIANDVMGFVDFHRQ